MKHFAIHLRHTVKCISSHFTTNGHGRVFATTTNARRIRSPRRLLYPGVWGHQREATWAGALTEVSADALVTGEGGRGGERDVTGEDEAERLPPSSTVTGAMLGATPVELAGCVEKRESGVESEEAVEKSGWDGSSREEVREAARA